MPCLVARCLSGTHASSSSSSRAPTFFFSGSGSDFGLGDGGGVRSVERRRYFHRHSRLRFRRRRVLRTSAFLFGLFKRKKKEDEDSPWWLMDEKAMKRFTDEGKEDVFRLRTTNLPGMSKDEMTPEGAATGALVLVLALWGFVIVIKLVALCWGILYAGLKYAAIAAILVLLGIASL